MCYPVDMKRTTVEPGLLKVFRFIIILHLSLLALQWLGQLRPTEAERIRRYPMVSIVVMVTLIAYLSWPWVRRQMGIWFLPVALVAFTSTVIFQHILNASRRLSMGADDSIVINDAWTVLVLLFVPLVLMAWQYPRVRNVIIFCVVTSVVEISLAIPLALAGGPPLGLWVTYIAFRVVLYLLVGYLVSRLSMTQRQQQEELTRTNARLVHYASTLEQLAISRERNRMARELHDTLAHTLSAVTLQLEAVESLWESSPDNARQTLNRAQELSRNGLREARRALQALRASPLEDLGLGLAVRQLAESAAQRAGLTLELDVPEQLEQVRPEVEQSLYRIAEEAIANVVRHANASVLSLSLRQNPDGLRLRIADDGRGFDPERLDQNGHYGLTGMQERVLLCGGTLEVNSRPGEGTVIGVSVV